MPFTKEQLKAYYEANRLKLNQQRTERRRLARLRQNNQLEVETVPNLEIGLRQVETLPKIETEIYSAKQIKSQPAKEVETVVDQEKNLQPKLDLEAYNREVYKRADTKDLQRFFTFPDGKKIVRTKCGCNKIDWCKDDCKYFTYWRNKDINNE